MKAVAVFPGKPDSIHLADLLEPTLDDVPDGRGVLSPPSSGPLRSLFSILRRRRGWFRLDLPRLYLDCADARTSIASPLIRPATR